MVKGKMEGKSGAAMNFISRRKAMKQLQLTLKDFRRLCILKGIYPREPRNRKKVSRGNSKIKTFYFLKDIQFLMHEPIIEKFRQLKVFARKVHSATDKKDFSAVKRLRNNIPIYKVDHIVKERYPTFTDALRDLDDTISTCYLFSTLPKLHTVHDSLIHLSRRLITEFMLYVIEARALRKVFISVKGFYYQAEIQGEKVTWVIPHQFGFQPPTDVDFNIMKTFVELYNCLLGFVNFKLYHSLNLCYPPKYIKFKGKEIKKTGELADQRITALSHSLRRITKNVDEDDTKPDEFLMTEDDPDALQRLQREEERVKKLQKLFEGLRFFLNREIPREPFTFVIRSFGGRVSWDKSLCAGSTYDETDEKITHQIVDRPAVSKQFLNRYYVQPQWVFDCVNAMKLVPPKNYFLGEKLPPHLSPFVEAGEGVYFPPEQQLEDESVKDEEIEQVDNFDEEEEEDKAEASVKEEEDEEESIEDAEEEEGEEETEDEESEEDAEEEESEENTEEEESEQDEKEVTEEKDEKNEDDDEYEGVNNAKHNKRKIRIIDKKDEDKVKTKEAKRNRKKRGNKGMKVQFNVEKKNKSGDSTKKMRKFNVQPGKVKIVDEDLIMSREKAEEKNLALMMLSKRKKKLYDKIMTIKRSKANKINKLQEKRRIYDEKQKRLKTNTRNVKKTKFT